MARDVQGHAMSLCGGLAILALCIPLPGQTRHDIQSAGWPIDGEMSDSTGWGTSRWLASGTYRLLVSMGGSHESIEWIALAEPKGASGTHLYSIIGSKCSSEHDGIRDCKIESRPLRAMPYIGGWLLMGSNSKTTVDDLKAMRERVRPLFEKLAAP